MLEQAKQQKRVVKLINYRSTNSSDVTDHYGQIEYPKLRQTERVELTKKMKKNRKLNFDGD